jgi:hypothetical protein
MLRTTIEKIKFTHQQTHPQSGNVRHQIQEMANKSENLVESHHPEINYVNRHQDYYEDTRAAISNYPQG